MENNFPNAVKLTIAGTIVCAILMWFFDAGSIPAEKILKITISSKNEIEIPLPFEVSFWWNLLLSPMIIIFLGYCYNQEQITGREPHSSSDGVQDKYEIRTALFIYTCLSLSFCIGIPTLMMLAVFLGEPAGFLTGVVSGVLWGLAIQIILCMPVSIFYYIFTDNRERTFYQKYLSHVEKSVKIGMVKMLPYIIGITIGFLIQLTRVSIWKFFKKATVGFKKSPVS